MYETALLLSLGLIATAILWVASRSWADSGAKTYTFLREMNRAEHEFCALSPADRPPVEREGYDAVDGFLAAHGFRHLGDVEDLTVSRLDPANRTYMASYSSADGLTTAGTWRLASGQTTQFASLASDGRVLLTSNAEADKLTPPPIADKLVLSAETSVNVLLARHMERMEALRSRENGTEIVRVDDIEALLAATRRYSRVQADHRRSLGLMTLDEMLALASNERERHNARVLWKDIQRRWATERRRS